MNAVELRKDALEETFKDVELLIYNIVHKFMHDYGIKENEDTFGDLKGHAFLSFIQAYDTFNFNDGHSFSTWLSITVRFRLQNYYGKELRRNKPSKRLKDYQRRVEINGLGELVSFLDDDACTVVNLILDTPKELMEMITEFGGKMRYVKNVLIDYLLEMGWHFEKIITAFTQIEKALA